MTRVVLASASPARLRTLRAAGLDPDVVVSGVPEDDVTGVPAHVALELARRKARAVAATVGPEALVIGCDSVLDIDGRTLGKPTDAGRRGDQVADHERTDRGAGDRPLRRGHGDRPGGR